MDNQTKRHIFWANIEVKGLDDCWVWQGSFYANGYGSFAQAYRCKLPRLAHRTAFILTRGSIPTSLFVLHKCDNKPCCNPTHLFLGTHQDNMQDKQRKGRQVIGIKNGRAKLSAAQVVAIRADLRTQEVLAKEFGVTHSTICLIKSRKRWGHII